LQAASILENQGFDLEDAGLIRDSLGRYSRRSGIFYSSSAMPVIKIAGNSYIASYEVKVARWSGAIDSAINLTNPSRQ